MKEQNRLEFKKEVTEFKQELENKVAEFRFSLEPYSRVRVLGTTPQASVAAASRLLIKVLNFFTSKNGLKIF